MAKHTYKTMLLDARPDRLDLRDREYRPQLKSLPPQLPDQATIEAFLPCYKRNGLILNQGQEGACTGFGLAATINYLTWRDKITLVSADQAAEFCSLEVKPLLVSERMLYHLARVYDEWDGEDYSGSSCRGAMKGWHRHGVCKKSLWDYDISGKFLPPKDDWAVDALKTPLGAYYRVDHEAVIDMQSAIAEVGAIYCSADVHEGWRLKTQDSLSVIEKSAKMIGGHAFCLIGYTQEGFIVQNSWGDAWGWNGFAVISYEDWVANGNDAWVVSRGVPVKAAHAPQMFSNNALQDLLSKRKDPAQSAFNKALKYPYPDNFRAMPWSEDKAYAHTLLISNNGRPKHTVIASADPNASALHICYHNLHQWLAASKNNRKIAIYAHGGLNSEEASINRVRIMAPYFMANGIYPLFIVWKTGLAETLKNIVKDAVDGIFHHSPSQSAPVEGLGQWMSDRADSAIEAVARSIHAKSLWSEMKENALYASDRTVPGFAQNRGGKEGANILLAKALEKLRLEFDDIELHLIGHSAGAILLGAWLKELSRRANGKKNNPLMIKTVSLYAPACTLEFANNTYLPAIEKGLFDKSKLFIHNMDDESEKADNTGGIYQKSLLYFVSRTLEDLHKMPLLGMAAAWNPKNYTDQLSGGFSPSQKPEMEKWNTFMKGGVRPFLYSRTKSRVNISLKPDYIDLSHGSFDNDIAVVELTLKKIKGSRLRVRVENLCGY